MKKTHNKELTNREISHSNVETTPTKCWNKNLRFALPLSHDADSSREFDTIYSRKTTIHPTNKVITKLLK